MSSNFCRRQKTNTLYIIEIAKLSTLEILLCFGQTLFRSSVIILTRDCNTYYNTIICMLNTSKNIIDSLATAGNKLFLICPILTHIDCISSMLFSETNFESLPSIWRLKSFCKAVCVYLTPFFRKNSCEIIEAVCKGLYPLNFRLERFN